MKTLARNTNLYWRQLMNRRWINTKVEFIWDGTQYVEQSAEGYWYDGEMALCVHWGEITSGTVDDLALKFQPTVDSYAGFQFVNEAGSNAGFCLVRANEDSSSVYKADGITLVADSGELTLATRVGNDDLRLMTGADGAAVTRMTIKGTSGNVGIGTTGPRYSLDVRASSGTTFLGVHSSDFVSGSTGANLVIQVPDSNSAYAKISVLNDGEATYTNLALQADGGNVGIGTASPSYELEVDGQLYSSGSSVDFKKHVTDMAIDSSAIYDLNPVSYEYKKDYKDFGYDLAGGKQVGLLSEDVAKTVPELAIMKDGKAQNVDYQKLSVLLLAEMKKLNKRLEALEAQ